MLVRPSRRNTFLRDSRTKVLVRLGWQRALTDSIVRVLTERKQANIGRVSLVLESVFASPTNIRRNESLANRPHSCVEVKVLALAKNGEQFADLV